MQIHPQKMKKLTSAEEIKKRGQEYKVNTQKEVPVILILASMEYIVSQWISVKGISLIWIYKF